MNTLSPETAVLAPMPATDAPAETVAVIHVDARTGVLPQMRWRTRLAMMTGARRVIVAVDAMDRVGHEYEVFKAVRARFIATVSGLDVPGLEFIPVTRNPTDMEWYDGPTLAEALACTGAAEPVA